MSCSIVISLPGLSEEVASELERRAELAGAPFTFRQSWRAGLLWRRREVRLGAELADLRDDPCIASESLDCEHGWPQDPRVREWFARAMRFLGENAPEGRFVFHAGWNEHDDAAISVDLGLEAFLERIAAGGLRSDETYAVSSR
jgi:hypothetical protein